MTPPEVGAPEAADTAGSGRNVKLVIAYDGTRYHGFQIQAGSVPTIQGELELALQRITGVATRVTGAGRTDTGVHATGQVVNFRTPSALPAPVLQRALNAVMPADLAVLAAEDVSPDFHARFSARSRQYRYTILSRPVRDPLRRRFSYHVAAPLDAQAMDRTAAILVGEHDFAALAGAGEYVQNNNTVRRVLSAGCQREGDEIRVDVAADAFLPHMVRNIVGTLVLAGTGKLDADGLRAILAARQRSLAGPTAPAQGLCLTKVNY